MCQEVSSQQGLSGALQLQLCVLRLSGAGQRFIGPQLLELALKHAFIYSS